MKVGNGPRIQRLIPGAIALAILATLAFSSIGAMGWNLVAEYDFTGTDGTPPSSDEWDVDLKDARNSIVYDNNRFRYNAVTTHWMRAISKWTWEANNFTMLLDWYPDTGSNGPLIIGTRTNESGTQRPISYVCYAPGYGWHTYRFPGGNSRLDTSGTNNLQVDRWYTVNITFRGARFNASVTQHGTGTVMWSRNLLLSDPHAGENMVYLGVSGATIYYDNLRIYDLDKPPNVAPEWKTIPHFQAVEDIPLTIDFSPYVMDTDGPLDILSISSTSPFYMNSSGFNVTFQFPNGVANATVPLVLSDQWDQATADVNFTIEPVNDPPEAFLPELLEARENIPLVFNATAYVSDIDNATEDLWLISDDPFVTTEGLILTATFPEALTEYEVLMGLTDGLEVTNFLLRFTIESVNDPPVIAPLGTFVAIEDQVSIFNLTPFLSDVDTPVEDLSVIVRSARCTVHGQELHFHNAKGGFNETLLVQVTDGWSMVEAYLEVVVEERNDPPFVYTTEPQQFTEDIETTIDMAEYISDEDTEIEDLTLTCKHPAVVSIDGLTITFNFTTWRPEHEIYYNVTDGYLITEGHFLVQVLSVNDAPRIHAIGDQEPPIVLKLDEGTSTEHQVWVVDEDDTNFKYLLSTSWAGATLGPYGMLVLDALQGDVGEYTATISVEDPEEARTELTFTILVLNLNDPPTPPVIMRPTNHTIVERGTNVTFAVSVTDPDEMYGQVLTVTWTSDISGVIGARTTAEGLEFTRNDLAAGVHRITVQVSDGEHVEERWFVLEVIEPYVSPYPAEDPSFLETSSGLGLMLLVVLAVIIIALLMVIRSRSSVEGPKVRTHIEEPEVTAEVEARKDLAALGAEIGAMADQLEATRAAEALPMYGPEPPTPTPAALDMEDVAAPTAEDYADRQHAIQVREVMKVLTQLPRGMPNTLWGKDMSLLAREIVDGPKRTAPDGTELVQVDGRWYKSDHTNVGTFLSEWKEKEKAPPGPSMDDKVLRDKLDKLDKLEERLLDGDISEETYERLRKKFEGS